MAVVFPEKNDQLVYKGAVAIVSGTIQAASAVIVTGTSELDIEAKCVCTSDTSSLKIIKQQTVDEQSITVQPRELHGLGSLAYLEGFSTEDYLRDKQAEKRRE